jgi:cellulose synthase/poly-beta-1,6-N-acetylglucosamine synthase-like glycosyltransferase
MEFWIKIILFMLGGSCALLLAHTYAFYPWWTVRRAKGRSTDLPPLTADDTNSSPEVVVVMAVYNEATCLEATLRSIKANTSGRNCRILAGSDGSTDGSDEIGRRLAADWPALEYRVFGGRQGKMRIVNELIRSVRPTLSDPDSAILVMCDANIVWGGELLSKLVRHFVRPEIGQVGAAPHDPAKRRPGIGDHEDAYINGENRLKHAEGQLWGCTIGAFGACHAMRFRLFEHIPENYSDEDFFLSMHCLASGYETHLDLEALCYESVSVDIREEFRRKRRISRGNFQNFAHFRELLTARSPRLGERAGPALRPGLLTLAYAFWSHKGLRWYGPHLLVLGTLAAFGLALLDLRFAWPAGLLSLAFAAAGADALLSRLAPSEWSWHLRPLRIVRYFFSMNIALFLGWYDYMRGSCQGFWEPIRRVEASKSGDPIKVVNG